MTMMTPKRTDLLLFAVAVAGLAVFLRYYESAFPQAAIELRLSRDEIGRRADAYLRERGFDPDTFQSTLTFSARASAAAFLQRVRGLEEASRFAREVLPLWSWDARWFRSGEKEEFRLELGPDAEPIQFEHEIPEAAPGDSLSQDSARVLAAAFVTDRLDVELGEWRLADEVTRARDRRIDHTFTWEKVGSEIEWRPDDPEAGTASLRLRVEVHGSRIGGFGRFLKVPEKFSREQSKETSLGGVLTLSSFALMFLLVIASLVVAIRRHKGGRVRWRWSLIAGAIAGGAALLAGVLAYPLLKSAYPTEIDFAAFVAMAVLGLLFAGLIYGLVVWVTGAAGESLTLDAFPRSLDAFREWTEGRWATPAAAREVLVGYAVGLGFVGYITAFYLLGRRYLGVWIPAEGPHSQLLGMYLPWLVPALIAIQASVSEEFMLRLFGISFCKRAFKLTFLALLVPAVIWAFGHSNYPVFPVYVRGIELTIAGLVFGWVFLRYGLVSMLVAHYAIDAILIAMPFLRAAGGTYVGYGVAALVIAALPLVIPAWALRGRGRGRPSPDRDPGWPPR